MGESGEGVWWGGGWKSVYESGWESKWVSGERV